MTRLAPVIAVVITVVWVASLAWSAYRPEYVVPPYVHLAFMSVAGALFGTELLRRGGNGS